MKFVPEIKVCWPEILLFVVFKIQDCRCSGTCFCHALCGQESEEIINFQLILNFEKGLRWKVGCIKAEEGSSNQKGHLKKQKQKKKKGGGGCMVVLFKLFPNMGYPRFGFDREMCYYEKWTHIPRAYWFKLEQNFLIFNFSITYQI